MAKDKNPYQMNLITANKTKLYNQNEFWAFNVAKYRALLTNDPAVIKYFYRHEAATFFPDVYNLLELKRSFYYGDEHPENAEEFFGIIPMICESVAKMVCGAGYEFDMSIRPEIKARLRAILDDNEFDTAMLLPSMIDSIGIGDGAYHVRFDPEVSDYPIIEFVTAERLFLVKKGGRTVSYGIKQQVIINDEEQPFELHTIYSKRRKKYTKGGAVRYRDDGVLQEFRIWDGSRYHDRDTELKKTVFEAYGIKQEKSVLPLADIPVIYLPCTLNNTQGAGAFGDARPYGIVFGLESVSSALDEILSSCTDTVRKCFPFLLIDEQMIPSNLEGDKDKGAFSTRKHSFVLPRNAKEAEKLLQMIQSKLNTTEYVEAAKFQINIALNKAGINAATLGLQLSGHVEAEATQNAKERNSIRTRNALAADFERYLSKLFAVLLQYEDYINGNVVARDRATGNEAFVVDDYNGIKVSFRKYIVDTPEEVSAVLAQKVQSNLMSVFAAVAEQHPEWDEETIYKEANLIYAQMGGGVIQVSDPSKPPEESVVMTEENADEGGEEPTDDKQAEDDDKSDDSGLQGGEKGKDKDDE